MKTESTDVAIIGAGPIGLEVAASLKHVGIEYLQFDAGQIGHTISWWPRNTPFFSTSERIAITGIPIQNSHQQRTTGEEYLAYLRAVVEQLDLQVRSYEPVVEIERQEEGFLLRTKPLKGEYAYRCRRVVMATGDMLTPQLLNIPGEDLPHISHYFTDPHRYFRTSLLVVGGRNSAVEAALRSWRSGARVTISYRQKDFDETLVKNSILPDLKTQIRKGNITFYPETVPMEITPQYVRLASTGADSSEEILHETDFVLLCTGFSGDSTLLEMVGVTLSGDERIPRYDEDTMESDVPGLYLAGTVAAGSQRHYRLFIENCHIHAAKITKALSGTWPDKIGTIPARKYDLPLAEIRSN